MVLLASLAAPAARAEEEAAPGSADAPSDLLHRVVFHREGREHNLGGRLLVEAVDGGVLLETDDGTLWTIEGSEVEDCRATDQTFRPLSQDDMVARLGSQLPDGFRFHTTEHYIVAYSTSRTYAQWTSSLLERLHRAFVNFWQRQGFELDEPRFPLVVVVFADRDSYHQATSDELGNLATSVVGYYSLRTNRVSMFDLSGAESARSAGNRRSSLKEINRMLSRPAAVPLVATIVHEATHQIAFNCGLQTRYADNPLWLCEGLAEYFEAPDLSSTRGWRGIGNVNYLRVGTFQGNLPAWQQAPGARLASLVADDQRFRNARQAPDAYADAWALCYYMLQYRPDQFAGYVRTLSKKKPLIEAGRDERLEEFRQHFGDLETLSRDFLKQMSRVR